MKIGRKNYGCRKKWKLNSSRSRHISDRARAAAEDVSGAVLVECGCENRSRIVEKIIVSDDSTLVVIKKTKRARRVNLIVTNGGTGSPARTDAEARGRIDREAPD